MNTFNTLLDALDGVRAPSAGLFHVLLMLTTFASHTVITQPMESLAIHLLPTLYTQTRPMEATRANCNVAYINLPTSYRCHMVKLSRMYLRIMPNGSATSTGSVRQ